MSDMWALALGILFFAIWVAGISYYNSARNAYIQGRIDQIKHKNRHTNYKGVPAVFYKRGRIAQAKKHRLKIHKRMSGNGHGTAYPR